MSIVFFGNCFRRLADLVRGRKGDFLSALAAEVSLVVLERVASENKDRRLFIADVAKEMGKDELTLLKRVARRMQLKVVEQVAPISQVQDRNELSFAELRKAGALPLYKGEALSGIVCANPMLAERAGALGMFPGAILSLARWSDISLALEESEHLQIKAMAERAEEERLSKLALCREFVSLVDEQSKSYGSDRVELFLEGSDPYYAIAVAQGGRAVGRINPLLAKALAQVLADEEASVIGEKIAITQVAGSQRFTLAFLTRKAEKKSLESASEKVALSTSSSTILLVDDNPTFLSVLERFFARHSIACVSASSGAEALGILRGGFSPALVVSDVHMPEMNGVELLKSIKSDAALKDLPVVILTSDGEVEMELSLVSLGADAFVDKCSDPRLLCAQVKRLMKQLSWQDLSSKVA